MAVILTSPVYGKAAGETYTGDQEDWLLSNGYARRDGYTGPGVANAGATTSVLPNRDPQSAANREAPYWPLTEDRDSTIANDETHLNETKRPFKDFDFDAGGVDDDVPVIESVTPASGPAGGGTDVVLKGRGFERVTAVNFGGSNLTDLKVVSDYEITGTTSAHAAGATLVTAVDPAGNGTKANGFTYSA